MSPMVAQDHIVLFFYVNLFGDRVREKDGPDLWAVKWAMCTPRPAEDVVCWVLYCGRDSEHHNGVHGMIYYR